MSDLSQLLGDLYADETPSAPAPAPAAPAAAPAAAAPEPAPTASPAPVAPTQVWSMDDEHDDATLHETEAPAWSSDDALDQAFASWVPGPSDDAPSAERSIVAGAMRTPPAPAPAPAPELDGWRDAPPIPAPVAPAPTRSAAPAPAPAHDVIDDDWRRDPAPALASPTVHARWAPSDDDILPARRGRKRR